MTTMVVTARVPEKLGEDFEAFSRRISRPKDELMAEAMAAYLEREAWLSTQIAEAVKAADASGEYISHEKMVAWLKSWGTPDELPPPEADIFKKPKK